MSLILEFKSAIITISDKGAKGERDDTSGTLASEMLKEAGYEIVEKLIIPDERKQIEESLIDLSEKQIDLVITTGGTGFAPRDVTPEATMAIAQRVAPGISEAIRVHSMQITGRAMLSRGVSVIRGRTLIINLPGSPKAVKESLEYILPHLPHGLEILKSKATECA